MMELVRLLPDQIMRYWDQISECISDAMPSFAHKDKAAMLQVQQRLLLQTLDCWIAMRDTESDIIYGVMTTQLVFDGPTRTRNLLIYSVSTISDHPSDMWQLAAEKLSKYATTKNCKHIIAYSNDPRMLHIAEKLGADTSFRLIRFNL